MERVVVPGERIGFAVVACGPYARTCKAETFIESLCRIGGWQGPVFLFTEEPRCFDMENLRRLAGNDQIQLVKVDGFVKSGGVPFTLRFVRRRGVPWPEFTFRSSQVMNEAKTLKARLLDLCPDAAIEVLIYSDADAIVVRNDQMPALMKLASEWSGAEGIKCRLEKREPDRPLEYTRSSRIHSGLLILHRRLSHRALEDWKKRLQNKKAWQRSPFDRDRFREAYDEIDLRGIHPNYMHVEVIPEQAGIEGFSNMEHAHMIEHISFGRLWANGHRSVEAYVDSFGLKSYPSGYYFLGPTPAWIKAVFYLGFFPSKWVFKIENVAKRVFG